MALDRPRLIDRTARGGGQGQIRHEHCVRGSGAFLLSDQSELTLQPHVLTRRANGDQRASGAAQVLARKRSRLENHLGNHAVALLLRLFLLVAVALLPAIAIQSYNEFDLRRSHKREAKEQALGLAKLAAAEQQQIVEGARQVLTALSELPAIKARDVEACNAYLSALKQR